MTGMMRWIKFITVCALIAALARPGFTPAGAQVVPRLSVQPPAVQAPVGNDLLIELYVTNGVDVNAFDVTVTYDSGVLALNKWEHGGYLKNLAVVSQVNQPGSLRVAATQLASPPVSGDGVLLKLNFRAAAAGVSPVTITRAEFASATGAKSEPERVNGTVTALVAPTFTPTVTVTATPTRTPTPLPTATLTSMPTATPATIFTPTSMATTGNAATATALSSATATRAAQLTRTLSAPGQASPTAGLDKAYPGEDLPEAVTPGATQPADGQPEGAPTGGLPTELEPDPEIVGEGDGDPADEPAEARDWRETLLWGALIGAGLAIGIMFLIIIRRNTRRERPEKEDLLL